MHETLRSNDYLLNLLNSVFFPPPVKQWNRGSILIKVFIALVLKETRLEIPFSCNEGNFPGPLG